MGALLRNGKTEGMIKGLLEGCDPLLATLIKKGGTPLTMDDLMRMAGLSKGRVMWGIGTLHGDGVLSQTFVAGSNLELLSALRHALAGGSERTPRDGAAPRPLAGEPTYPPGVARSVLPPADR